MKRNSQEKRTREKPSRQLARGLSNTSQRQTAKHKKVRRAGGQQIRQLIEASPLAMVVSSGLEQQVELVNNRFTELFGYILEDVPDVKHWWPLAYPDEKYRENIKAQWQAKVEQAVRLKSRVEPMEATVTCKDGSQRQVEFCLSSIGRKNIIIFVDLTERKQAELKIQRLADIVESSDDAIIGKTLDGTVLCWNKGAEKIYGYTEAEVLGRSVDILAPPERQDEIPQILKIITNGEHIDHFETVRRTKDGRDISVSLTISPIYDSTGRVVGASTIGRDITERKHAEEALQKTNSLLERIFSTTEFLIAYMDTDFNFIRVNRAYAEADGQTPDYFIGKNHFALYPNQENEAIFHKVLETGEPYVAFAKPFTYAAYPKRGITYWDWTLQPVKDELNGHISGLCFSLVNVTEREKAIAAQHESDDRYRTLVEQASDGIFLADPEGNYLDANVSGCSMLGYTREELLKLNMKDLVSREEQTRQPIRFEELRSGKHVLSERLLVTKDGTLIPTEISGQVLENGNFLGIIRDVTERARSEEALLRSEQKFRALAENIPNVVFQCRNDSRYTFLYLNDAVEKLTGYPKDEFLEKGLSFFDLYHPDDLKSMPTPDNNKPIINRDPFHVSYRIRHKSGEWRWVDEWGTGVTNAIGEVEYLEGVMVDVTDRKRHELEREAIIAVSAALRQATTRNEILNVILGQLEKLFETDGTMLVLPDPQTGGFIDEMGRGVIGERMTGLNIPPGKGVCNWVITNKAPYLNNQVDMDPIFYRADLLGDSRCIASVPLISQEQAIGALWIARHTNILEQELRLLNAIADIAANALHRVMLHEQTEQQLHHLIALHQIDLAISTNFDLNVTLNVLLSNVIDELAVDAASILLLDALTHTLNFAAGVGFRTSRIEKSHVKLGDGCAGRAAQEYRTVSCLDLGQERGVYIRSSLLAEEEFVSHYATPLIVKGQVKGILEIFHRKTLEPKRELLDYFETLATQAAIAIESASLFENLQRSNLELVLAYDATIEGWSRALDLRDRETEGHTQRVTEMVLQLAERMGLRDAEKLEIRRGALLHDIGKMGVPDAILLKPGPLSEQEWEIMKQHPTYAYQMLSPIAYLRHAVDIPYCHHEKWDGSGYPRGLKKEEIPLNARLFSIVDVYDALTSDRPYRAAWSRERVRAYIQEQAGQAFDPELVKLFLETI